MKKLLCLMIVLMLSLSLFSTALAVTEDPLKGFWRFERIDLEGDFVSLIMNELFEKLQGLVDKLNYEITKDANSGKCERIGIDFTGGFGWIMVNSKEIEDTIAQIGALDIFAAYLSDIKNTAYLPLFHYKGEEIYLGPWGKKFKVDSDRNGNTLTITAEVKLIRLVITLQRETGTQVSGASSQNSSEQSNGTKQETGLSGTTKTASSNKYTVSKEDIEKRAVAGFLWMDRDDSLLRSMITMAVFWDKKEETETAEPCPVICGKGEYTVSIDFKDTPKGYVEGMYACGIEILNGEKLFPDWIIRIKSITVNGEKISLKGNPYTCSHPYADNVTFLPLYYPDLKALPASTRAVNGISVTSKSLLPELLPPRIKTVEVTFSFEPDD